jgi:hypothetical protein
MSDNPRRITAQTDESSGNADLSGIADSCVASESGRAFGIFLRRVKNLVIEPKSLSEGNIAALSQSGIIK